MSKSSQTLAISILSMSSPQNTLHTIFVVLLVMKSPPDPFPFVMFCVSSGCKFARQLPEVSRIEGSSNLRATFHTFASNVCIFISIPKSPFLGVVYIPSPYLDS